MKEKAFHLNFKELLAVHYSLRSFKTYFRNKHVKLFLDSQVGVQIINKMGTTKSSICNDIVKRIWLFCVKNKIWIPAANISWCWKCDCRLWIKKKLQTCRVDAESWNISKGNEAPKPWTRSWLLRINAKYTAT